LLSDLSNLLPTGLGSLTSNRPAPLPFLFCLSQRPRKPFVCLGILLLSLFIGVGLKVFVAPLLGGVGWLIDLRGKLRRAAAHGLPLGSFGLRSRSEGRLAPPLYLRVVLRFAVLLARIVK
jgi:hypothetical protein